MGVSERLWWTGSETCRTDEDGGTRIKLQIRDAPRASWEESRYSRHTRLQSDFSFSFTLLRIDAVKAQPAELFYFSCPWHKRRPDQCCAWTRSVNDRSWTRSYFGWTWTECTYFCLRNFIVNMFIVNTFDQNKTNYFRQKHLYTKHAARHHQTNTD